MSVAKASSLFGNECMSRIGKNPVAIPPKAEVSFSDGVLTVKGPLGTLSRKIDRLVSVAVGEKDVTLTPSKNTDRARVLWGTFASHTHNMLHGVTEGFKKELIIEGVGYRAELKGNTLVCMLGFSHPVSFPIPDGITVTVEKNVVTVSGADKEAVGQFAAVVRAAKKPEPYKGKGVRYSDEYVIRKQGKRAV